jgi:hypothetical protein
VILLPSSSDALLTVSGVRTIPPDAPIEDIQFGHVTDRTAPSTVHHRA